MEITSYLMGKKASGGGSDEYFDTVLYTGSADGSGVGKSIKKLPTFTSSDSNTTLAYAFTGCKQIENISIDFSTSNITNFSYMFKNCNSLKQIPQFDTSNGTNFSNMFYNCFSLTEIPQFDTTNATNFSSMFGYCNNLITVPKLKAGNVDSILSMFTQVKNIINLGGFEELGKAYDTSKSANYENYKLNISLCTNLTHDSLMNVINNLYDIKTKGCNNQKLVLGSTNLAKLTAEEIAIAENKGWNVTAS